MYLNSSFCLGKFCAVDLLVERFISYTFAHFQSVSFTHIETSIIDLCLESMCVDVLMARKIERATT